MRATTVARMSASDIRDSIPHVAFAHAGYDPDFREKGQP